MSMEMPRWSIRWYLIVRGRNKAESSAMVPEALLRRPKVRVSIGMGQVLMVAELPIVR